MNHNSISDDLCRTIITMIVTHKSRTEPKEFALFLQDLIVELKNIFEDVVWDILPDEDDILSVNGNDSWDTKRFWDNVKPNKFKSAGVLNDVPCCAPSEPTKAPVDEPCMCATCQPWNRKAPYAVSSSVRDTNEPTKIDIDLVNIFSERFKKAPVDEPTKAPVDEPTGNVFLGGYNEWFKKAPVDEPTKAPVDEPTDNAFLCIHDCYKEWFKKAPVDEPTDEPTNIDLVGQYILKWFKKAGDIDMTIYNEEMLSTKAPTTNEDYEDLVGRIKMVEDKMRRMYDNYASRLEGRIERLENDISYIKEWNEPTKAPVGIFTDDDPYTSSISSISSDTKVDEPTKAPDQEYLEYKEWFKKAPIPNEPTKVDDLYDELVGRIERVEDKIRRMYDNYASRLEDRIERLENDMKKYHPSDWKDIHFPTIRRRKPYTVSSQINEPTKIDIADLKKDYLAGVDADLKEYADLVKLDSDINEWLSTRLPNETNTQLINRIERVEEKMRKLYDTEIYSKYTW